jgi:hypothetical protein
MLNPRLFGVLAVATLSLIGPSPAHQSWISEEGAKNPVTGSWCCGVHDCGIVMPAPIATDAGWAIHGDVIIDVNGRRVRVDEVVPYNEAIASPDGHFWRCHSLEVTFFGTQYETYADGEAPLLFRSATVAVSRSSG